MSECSSGDDIARILARAFAQICERHLQDEGCPISEGVVRSLKHHLVALVREGARDEQSLTLGGLIHLWLGDEPRTSDNIVAPNTVTTIHSNDFQFRGKSTNARFLQQYRLGSIVFQISPDVLA